MSVEERLNTTIKLIDADGEAITKANADQAGVAEGADATESSPEVVTPSSTGDMIEAERRSRKADMEKLKCMDRLVMKKIAQLDMMGEYGSKVCSPTAIPVDRLIIDQLSHQAPAVAQRERAQEWVAASACSVC